MKTRLPRIASALAALAFLAATGAAAAADLKVFSTTAFTELWRELKPKFEARGHKLELVLQPSGAIGKRIAGGEAGDAIVSTTAGVEALEKGGKLVPGTTRVLASSGMGVAVLKGAPKPDISTPESFRRALLAAKSVAYSDPAGGGAIQQIPELMTISGVDIVGPFPPALQSVTGFATAVLSSSTNPAAAKALVEFLASPETLALLKSRGYDVKP